MREKVAFGSGSRGGASAGLQFVPDFLVLPDEACRADLPNHLLPCARRHDGDDRLLRCADVQHPLPQLRQLSLRFARRLGRRSLARISPFVNIVTGSIWARIIWGIWWTWDYRLTSALVCILIFFGYLMLRGHRRADSARPFVLGVVHFRLHRRRHRLEVDRVVPNPASGPVLSIRTGGGNIDPAMEHMLYLNFLAILMIAIALVLVRTRQESVAREIDSLRRLANAS